jgi:hypothetical protein
MAAIAGWLNVELLVDMAAFAIQVRVVLAQDYTGSLVIKLARGKVLVA